MSDQKTLIVLDMVRSTRSMTMATSGHGQNALLHAEKNLEKNLEKIGKSTSTVHDEPDCVDQRGVWYRSTRTAAPSTPVLLARVEDAGGDAWCREKHWSWYYY